MQQLDKYNFSDDFQDLILACMMRHPDKFSLEGEVIAPKLFNGPAAYDACYEIREWLKKNKVFPDFTILGNLVYQRYAMRNPDRAKECVEYVKKLSRIDTSNAEGVRDMVIAFAKERAVQNALRIAMDASYQGKEVEGGLVKLFDDALQVGTNLDDMGIWLHTDIDTVRSRLDSKDFGVPTGYECLDKLWRRGFGKGWLVVPLAPPKRFKSTFCLNMCLQMARPEIDSDIFYYACEISQELAFMRGLINLTGMPESYMYDSPETFWGKAKEILSGENPIISGNFMFKGFASKTTTVAQIRAHAKNVIKKTNIHPKMIVIDYAETVRSSAEKGTSDWRAQAEIYTEARAMGDELGCCILMPDRCNADAVDKKVPSMKSFQGSFEKAGIVDAAIGICATEAEYKQNKVRYFVFVNRHGPQYVHFEGKVDPERYRMTIDREIEYDPEAEERELEEKKAFRRGGGGARTGRKPSPAEVKRGVDALTEDD
jgi:hypothetical protein